MSIATNIRNRRTELRLSQADLGKLIGSKRLTIISWESGATEPKGEKLKQLAVALNTSIESLVTGEFRDPAENSFLSYFFPVPLLFPDEIESFLRRPMKETKSLSAERIGAILPQNIFGFLNLDNPPFCISMPDHSMFKTAGIVCGDRVVIQPRSKKLRQGQIFFVQEPNGKYQLYKVYQKDGTRYFESDNESVEIDLNDSKIADFKIIGIVICVQKHCEQMYDPMPLDGHFFDA